MKEEQRRKKKILLAKILICFVVLLIIVLPQVIGTADTIGERGEWKDLADLNGRNIGAVQHSELAALSEQTWPDATIVYAEDFSELPSLLANSTIDGFIAPNEDVDSILRNNPQFTVMMNSNKNSLFPGQENVFSDVSVIVASANYAYTPNRHGLDFIKRPGVKIAGITGSELAVLPEQLIPGSQIENYNNFADMFAALESGKVDAVAAYYTQIAMINENYKDLAYIYEPLTTIDYGFGTRKDEKGNDLKNKFNQFLEKLETSGEYRLIVNKWINMPEDGDSSLNYTFSGENGILHVCTPGTWFPMTFFKGDQPTGMFVDLVDRFCLEYGYEPKYECVDYPTQVAGIATGAYDIMADTLFITPERLEQLNITDSVIRSYMYIVERTDAETVTASKAEILAKNLSNGFRINFINDERWKMVLSGVLATILLSLLSGVIGTILGAVICRMRMSRNAAVTAFAQLYVKAVQGIPILVLLMVLYYLIFNNDKISAFAICVIGFSLDFAAYVSEIFRSGIEAVPPGQARAAKALGFTPVHGFVKVVLPQAMQHILPVYSGQLVSMVKLTSVAGYISVMELTKVTDIIRSRTYDAFFPLLTAALIYFLLSNLLILIMKLISGKINRIDPARRLKDINKDFNIPETGISADKSAGASKDLLVIDGLAKSFEEASPLKNVCCTVKTGDVISVIGPSGTGKSTLLNLINHLEIPDKGKILFDGEDTLAPGYDYSRLRRRVGMVFQSFNLFSHLTVVENIMLAQTELLKRSRQEAYERSMALLDAVGLMAKAYNYPYELSGGQQQRVAIARAIAMDPEIMLFDEPTSALDPTMVGEVLTVIRNLAQKGMTMLIVTHEMKFARDVSNRVFYMDEGVIYEEGEPEQIFTSPAKDKTRQFINHLRILTYKLKDNKSDALSLIHEVDSFSHRYMVPQKVHLKLLTVAEELCMNSSFVEFGNDTEVDISFEFSPENNSVHFTVDYGGTLRDPLTDDETIPVKLLKNASSDLAYTSDGGRNHIEGSISQ